MMPSAATQLLCQQCGAPLVVEPGTQFVTCEFCHTTNFVDKSGAVLHYVVRDTLGEAEANAALRRWMAGNDTVKDLDKKASIGAAQFQLFPMWMVTVAHNGAEKVVLEPAAALSVIELTSIAIPAADLEPYDHTLDANALEPTVPLETVKKWLADNQQIASGAIQATSLVHLPIFLFKYEFGGRTYTAVVDAANGRTFASVFPSKWEVPYKTLGSIGCVVYFLAALIPLAGYTMAGGAGLVTAMVVYLVVAAVLAVPIFVAATVISSKV
ncbi:MAG: hypothetical protein KC413_00115 [Anaerolineales bacterium]|nr:hypothetical protein [Anaerolineales bacterium]MCA9974110.1 hypothetical protein [Anaerolineales bacterium]